MSNGTSLAKAVEDTHALATENSDKLDAISDTQAGESP
jgi:hypothetical protein